MKEVKHDEQNSKISIKYIEQLALKGKDVKKHFSGGKMMPPLTDQAQRVHVDFGIIS